jgi:chromosome segregation ATPase
VEAGQKIPGLEGEVATLSLEVEVQRSSLLQIVTPSFELTRTLEGCERDRRKVDQERQGYEELRAVEARRDERLKALERLAQGRAEVTEELARKESAVSAFPDLDGKMQASRREIENTDRLIISCRRERDSLIARQAQIKQRQDQLEAARTRLAQVEAELGTARTELRTSTTSPRSSARTRSNSAKSRPPDQKSRPWSTPCWRGASTTSSKSASERSTPKRTAEGW